MEKYNVIEISKDKIKFLIIANTYENPINDFISEGHVPFIENGDVIFDLAIINGINFNRFIRATIRQHRLITQTIQAVSNVAPEILNISKEYFKSNKGIVKRSTLPLATKFLLINKCV